jgi:hypothetical protein
VPHSEKNDADAATRESIGIGIYEWQLLNHRHQHLLAQTLKGTILPLKRSTPRGGESATAAAAARAAAAAARAAARA